MSSTMDAGVPPIPALRAATLCEAFQITAAQRPDQVAHRAFGSELEFSFADFAARVRAIATGLHALGVRHGDTVALMLVNRPEFNLVDTAAMHLGAVPFSVYNTSSPEQIAQMFGNAGNRVVVTERLFLPGVLAARTPQIEHIVLIDGDARGTLSLTDLMRRPARGFDFDASWRAVEPDDVVTLIYTSGTTGPPKAAQLTHAGSLFEARAFAQVLPMKIGGHGISYLPSAHVGDRVLNHYCSSICLGTTLTSLADHRQIGAALAELHPTSFGAVPRVWEKLKAGLEFAGVVDPAQLSEQTRAAVRARLGLDRADWCLTGAAPAAIEVMSYFRDLGMPLNEGWGMSELTGFATLNPPGDIRIGSVGKALPGVSLRLDADGELLVNAPLVMKGYRNDAARTAQTLAADGWLRTGDIAQIDGDGYVRIVDRKKDLIINSAGKNMSPANIELRLRASSPLIAHAVCIGDRRPYNVALVVLDPELKVRWAAQHGLAGMATETLHEHPELRAAIHAAVEGANAGLSRVEQIKRHAILGNDWQPGGDEITPTMKLKRRPIHEKYREQIEALYR